MKPGNEARGQVGRGQGSVTRALGLYFSSADSGLSQLRVESDLAKGRARPAS